MTCTHISRLGYKLPSHLSNVMPLISCKVVTVRLRNQVPSPAVQRIWFGYLPTYLRYLRYLGSLEKEDEVRVFLSSIILGIYMAIVCYNLKYHRKTVSSIIMSDRFHITSRVYQSHTRQRKAHSYLDQRTQVISHNYQILHITCVSSRISILFPEKSRHPVMHMLPDRKPCITAASSTKPWITSSLKSGPIGSSASLVRLVRVVRVVRVVKGLCYAYRDVTCLSLATISLPAGSEISSKPYRNFFRGWVPSLRKRKLEIQTQYSICYLEIQRQRRVKFILDEEIPKRRRIQMRCIKKVNGIIVEAGSRCSYS